MTNEIDYERISAENGNGRVQFTITVEDETSEVVAEVTVDVNNMNDHQPIFVDKNGEEISRLDIYFNGKGTILSDYWLKTFSVTC